MNSPQAVCVPELVRLIHAVSCETEDISVQELAALIEKDPSILAKVIGSANSLGYNPTGVEILTVTQAIHIVGFNRVRSLAMSLMLMEEATRTTSPQEQREMAALTLCSGLLAQAAAAASGDIDPEQAFVCASLRNFGKLLMASFMNEEFRTAQSLGQSVGDDRAYEELFGLSPLALGHELLKSANLPPTILQAVSACRPEAIAAARSPAQLLYDISDLSLRVSEAALDPRLPAGDFSTRLQRISRQFEKSLPLVVDQLDGCIAEAQEKLSHFARQVGAVSTFGHAVSNLQRRVSGQNLPPPPPRAAVVGLPPVSATARPAPATGVATPSAPAAAAPVPPDSGAVPAAAPPPLPPPTEDVLRAGLDRLRRSRQSRPTTTQVLEIVAEAFLPDETVYLAADPGGRTLSIAQGRGALARTVGTSPVVAFGERSVFGVCLSRLENVLIHDTSDPKLAPYLPAWTRAAGGLGAFVLLPLHHERQPSALILAGWRTPRRITLTAEQATLLRELLHLVSAPPSHDRHAA